MIIGGGRMEIFKNIDFSNSKVMILFLGLISVITIILIAIFIGFKLIIPKSKLQDIDTLNQSIKRLKKLILFDKFCLLFLSVSGVILILLHQSSLIDLFSSPFNFLILGVTGLLPIFIVAVFGTGSRSTSSNKRALQKLYKLKNNVK